MTNDTPLKVLISGAGIAGLSCALALKNKGVDVTIIERAKSSRIEGGLGIALPANAMLGFRKLELEKLILNASHKINKIRFGLDSGTTLSTASLEKYPLNKAAFVALLRSDLIKILIHALNQEIHYNTLIEDLQDQEDGIKVSFEQGKEETFDYVVGAEGIHSSLRDTYFPENECKPMGVTHWRFTIQWPNHGKQPEYWLGSEQLFMFYPLNDDLLYCYAHSNDQDGLMYRNPALKMLKSRFSTFFEDVSKAIDLTLESKIYRGRLYVVNAKNFYKKRLILLGDALHGCPPSLQQGVGLSVEEGLILAKVLTENNTKNDEVLKPYQELCQKRVNWVVDQSAKMLKMANMGKTLHGRILRNLLICATGPRNVAGWKKLLKDDVPY